LDQGFGGLLRTIAVIALKGGSGKTTIATHMALAAHLRGLDVALVDLDPQRSAHGVLSAREGARPDYVASSGPDLMAAQFAAIGVRKDLLIVDTAAGAVEAVGEAIVLSDLAVLVARPTLLDLAGLAPTLSMVRRLNKAYVVVVNQAPAARGTVESPLVRRALKGLDYLRANVAPVIVRARTMYQTALESGRSAEEMADGAAAKEIAALWECVQAMASAEAEEAQRA